MLEYVLYIAIGWNLFVMLVYGYDKICAMQGYWRVPEMTLLILAFIWGSVGALLGMLLFRHKVQKWQFRIALPMFLFLHVVFAGWLIYHMSM